MGGSESAAFLEGKEKWVEETRVGKIADMLNLHAGMTTENAARQAKDNFDEAVERVEKGLEQSYENSLTDARDNFKTKMDEADAKPSKKEQKKQRKIAKKEHLAARKKALETYRTGTNELNRLEAAGYSPVSWTGRAYAFPALSALCVAAISLRASGTFLIGEVR